MRKLVSWAGLLGLAACAGVSQQITVTDSGAALSLAPRQADCTIEFFRTKPPDRRYDEIATLHLQAASAAAAQDSMRAKACELGADAVIVTRDVVEGLAYLTGTAVSYPELRDVHRAEHALFQKNKRDEFENAVSEATPPTNLPAGYVAARIRRDTALRFAPGGLETGQIAAGRFLWVDPEARRGYRRAVASDGSTGYVDEDALEFAPAAPAPPAPSPGQPSARQRTDI